MAIYHCSVKTVSRASGASVMAAAAYRSGETLTDTRTGLTHDYTRRGGVLHTEIMTPAGSPAWAQDREALWNAVEAAEDKSTRRDTAKTAREFELALPHELTHDERLATVRAFGRYMVDAYGVAVDFAIHAPHREGDDRNFHAHVLTSTRVLTDAGFKGKVRELDSPKTSGEHIKAIREKWAEIANRALEAGGHEARISAKSYADQGSDKTATVHMGPTASSMERRGEQSDIGDLNRTIQAENAERARLKAEAADLDGKIVSLEAERQKRAEDRADRAAVRTFSPERILEQITARRSTFTESELAWTLQKEVADPYRRKELTEAILCRPEVIGLAEKEGGKATRYTTAAVLEHEKQGMAAAGNMAADRSHAVSRATLLRVMEKGEFGTMREEQRAAVFRATGPEGLSIVAGEAGTGKSYTMNAIRQAYEAEGGRVVGLAFTNKVIQDMKRDGFAEVRTITGALQDAEKGRAGWDRRTVLMVDEAAMLATKDLVPLLERAKDAGAKVVLVGDEQQLTSIARGGLFGALREQHGAAVLQDVTRVDDLDQRRAFNAMHRGDFREALQIFDQQGRVHWSERHDDARAALAAQWAADTAEKGDRVRFVFAYTNAEALAVNADLRAIRKERGELGEDHILRTKDGPAAFAAGDRVQFTGSAYHREARDAGLANGMVGTVAAVDGHRMTVALDGKKGEAQRVVSFTVGEDARAGEFNAVRHGYAGTIYKGQGSTVDDAYSLHSRHWRAASSYVAATRHRDGLQIFAARDTAADLEQLARQMGRRDESRAASQFELAAPDPARSFASAAREAARRTEAPEAPKTPAPAESAPTPRQTANAQRIAARLGKITDPAKQGAALFRQHQKDATKRADLPPTPALDKYAAASGRLADKRQELRERDAAAERDRLLNRDRGRTR